MFDWFSRPRVRAVALPSLELLEDRFCPANPGISLTLAYAANQQVTLSGTVTDSAPANLPVQFSGAVTGSTTTDSNGNFTVTLTATALGSVTASVTDGDNQSAAVGALVNDVAPQLTNFGVSPLGGGYYTFYGQVSYQAPQLLTVSFTGNVESLTGKTTPVNAQGQFNFPIKLDGTGDDNGIATAQVLTDWWGNNPSNSRNVTVNQQQLPSYPNSN